MAFTMPWPECLPSLDTQWVTGTSVNLRRLLSTCMVAIAFDRVGFQLRSLGVQFQRILRLCPPRTGGVVRALLGPFCDF